MWSAYNNSLVLLMCRRGGKTPWEASGSVEESEDACSVEGCGCKSFMTAALHPAYAKELGMLCLEGGSNEPYSKHVTITIQPDHSDHDPRQNREVNLLRVDARVKSKIKELASSHMLWTCLLELAPAVSLRLPTFPASISLAY